MRKIFLIGSVLFTILMTYLIIWHYHWGWLLMAGIIMPLVVLGIIDMYATTNNIRRHYPLFGRITEMLNEQRHVFQETFLQNSTEGRPFTKIQQYIVYKRADDELVNFAFGTELDYNAQEHNWLRHSLFPGNGFSEDLRVPVGGPACRQPYSCSLFNIAGMSYGSISKNATMALNGGAAIGGFAQNTGEGGLTPYHKKYGGDLIFQFGTGYFGCRDENGDFDDSLFQEIAREEQVKMIEIKISQGAKPGYGAILPAAKNTKEIARFRKLEPHTEVISPPHHEAFSNARELAIFINKLRKLSDGKPIGIKFCLGNAEEFREICKAGKELEGLPDFVCVDGGEGGSGAADVDAIHYVGMPLKQALPLVDNILREEKVREQVSIFAAGKIISSFDILKMKLLGADVCYSARGMMFALGCVQSLKCNKNTCPTGVATMDKEGIKALVVTDKKEKVANYHRNTIQGVCDLLNAAGLTSLDELKQEHLDKLMVEKEDGRLS